MQGLVAALATNQKCRVTKVGYTAFMLSDFRGTYPFLFSSSTCSVPEALPPNKGSREEKAANKGSSGDIQLPAHLVARDQVHKIPCVIILA